MSESLAFLQKLWGQDPPGGLYIHLWQRGNKQSSFHRSTADASSYADSNRADQYVCVSLADRNYGPTRRVKAMESAGIAGLWADIDIVGGPEQSANKDAAPDVDTAAELAYAVLEPTLLVHSGYGLQAWWLFEDGPWVFGSKEEREQAARVAAGWIELLRSEARQRGFGIDAVQDLARLMRIPGTLNTKGGSVAPCTGYPDQVHHQDGPLYDLEVLAERVQRVPLAATAVRDALGDGVDDIEMRPDPSPPFAKWNALMENSPQFKKTWHKNRRDGRAPTWSQSDWDQSIASQAEMAGWSDQELADTIRAFRKMHGDPEGKADRLDYVKRTIRKAHSRDRAEERERKVEGHLENLAAMAEEERPDADAVMDEFNALISAGSLRVRDFYQYGKETKTTRYKLVLDNGEEILLGGPDELQNPDRVRSAFMSHTRFVMPSIKKAKWLDAIQALLKVAQVQVNEDDTLEGQVRDMLQRYVGEAEHGPGRDEACTHSWPFVEDDKVHVYAGSFGTFVTKNLGRRISDPDIKAMLRAAGFENRGINYHPVNGNGNGKRRMRNYYVAPKGAIE